MIVAYFVPHNDGVEFGIITGPGFDTDISLVDLYEVDATIKSFDGDGTDLWEATTWLKGKIEELAPGEDPLLRARKDGSGSRGSISY